jgi:hypothetical protein
MAALRTKNDPDPLAGAEVATRYCSPQNRASELSPEVFARYLEVRPRPVELSRRWTGPLPLIPRPC